MEKSKSKSDNEFVAKLWQAKAYKAHRNVKFFIHEWQEETDPKRKYDLLMLVIAEMNYRKDRSAAARETLLKAIAA